jgi:DNA-binding transcriptional MerR regulator
VSSRIGALARRYGLSRSTLLYYDRIGLLKPSGRLANGYRQYSGGDESRLRRIVMFRKTGVSMREIRRMLDGGSGSLLGVLEQRLEQLNADIAALREQQRFILGLLECRKVHSRVGVMNLDLWVNLLKASGFGQENISRWHSAFERSSPAGHQKFLEFLCLPSKEIERIRRASREQERKS